MRIDYKFKGLPNRSYLLRPRRENSPTWSFLFSKIWRFSSSDKSDKNRGTNGWVMFRVDLVKHRAPAPDAYRPNAWERRVISKQHWRQRLGRAEVVSSRWWCCLPRMRCTPKNILFSFSLRLAILRYRYLYLWVVYACALQKQLKYTMIRSFIQTACLYTSFFYKHALYKHA